MSSNVDVREFKQVRVKIFRLLGLLLGMTAVGLGVMLLALQHEDGWYRGFVVPVSMMGSGLYFLAYAISGRARLVRSKEPADESRM